MRALTLGLLVLAGCYRPSLGDCQVRCSSASPACPSGLSCDTAEGFCQADMARDCSSIVDPPDGGGPPPGTATYVALSVGAEHACAIRDDRTMWCWGDGHHGALGDGQNGRSAVPVRAGEDADWFAVSAGLEYTCGLRDGDATQGGTLHCWGLNNYGQLDAETRGTDAPAPLDVGKGKRWKSVSASRGGHTCAIDDMDHLYCGGENDVRQLGTGSSEPFLPLTRVGGATPLTWRSVSAAYFHTCGITTDGLLFCWGGNNDTTMGGDGSLGTGDNVNHETPARVGTASDWVAVSAAPNFTCGIRGTAAGGNLYCWGRNSGNLGVANGGGSAQPTPLLVGAASDDDWKTISCDGRHSFGVRDAGGKDLLHSFGLNEFAVLGLGDRKDRTAPTRLDETTAWQRGGAGTAFGCGLRADGAVLCWGLDDEGQTGDGRPSLEPAPVRIGTDVGWTHVAPGEHHTCALRGTELYCWGMNQFGQLGLGAGETDESPSPARVPGSWKDVATGSWHTCGIDGTDALLCWGNNIHGALGTGEASGGDSVHSVPKKVTGAGVPTTWAQVGTGMGHTCAVASAGSLWCWGANFSGQLGLGALRENQPRPVRVGVDVEWTQVVGGTDHTCALRTGDFGPDLYCFGSNGHGQLGRGTVGGESGDPMIVDTSTTLLGSISATGDHTCALAVGDELRCWGVNSLAQLGDGSFDDRGTPVAPLVAGPWRFVGPGHRHTCAVRDKDSTLWCWGWSEQGQLATGIAVDEVVDEPTQVREDTNWGPVQGGVDHACAIQQDGSLWCWGRSSRGQVGNGQTSTLRPARIVDPAG